MKSVGNQLQEARAARNWTPEMASRETKIKLDRLRDLEADDYSHFSSPAYARGFVRTYARALNLDEYKILRQLDNKLPEGDHSVVHDSGIAYTPVPATPSGLEGTGGGGGGLLVVMGLGFVITLVLGFVLFEAYRSGDLPRYFGHSGDVTATSAPATNATASEAPARALPVDPNAVPPSNHALPVDPNATAATTPTPASTSAPTNAAPDVAVAPKALPVDPSELTNAPAAAAPAVAAVTPAAPATPAPTADATNAPPRALPVDPSELAAMATPTTEAVSSTNAAPVAASAPPPRPRTPSLSARGSGNESPVLNDAGLPVQPAAATNITVSPVSPAGPADPSKRLVLTASHDSFLRVTAEDAPDVERVLYASVLHSGQSVAFDGRKFSVNVGVPSAVNITLDGVNYGPHSDEDAPETFTVESHQP